MRRAHPSIREKISARCTLKTVQKRVLCERFHRTVLSEFYRVVFQKKVYRSIDELQTDLESWIKEYNCASQHPFVYVIEENRVC